MSSTQGLLGYLKKLLGLGRRTARPPRVAAYNPLERGLSQLQLEFVQDWASRRRRFERTTLIATARYFESTSALANRLARLYVDYVVGPGGIICLPSSSDETWNDTARSIWNDLADRLVLGPAGQNGWASAQAYMVWRWFFDGELFLYKTYVDGEPRLQPIECDRVKTPTQEPAAQIIDGVEIDRRTYSRKAYWIEVEPAKFQRVDANDIVHIFDPNHADQLRGIPLLEPVLTDLHCLQDLEMYEMRAHADAAEKSTIWKLSSGEFSLEDIRRGDLGAEPIQPTDALSPEHRVIAYSKAVGGRAVAIGTDEDVMVVQPARPTQEQRAFWDYLINKICVGVGIPRQLVAPYSVQGTVARADLAAARNSLLSTSDMFSRVVKHIYLWAIGSRMAMDPQLRAKAPPDWDKVSLRLPRQIDVDLGRSSAAMIEELKHGATHWEIIYGQLGLDWKEELRKRAEQLSYMKGLAQQFGLDPAWLCQTMDTQGQSATGESGRTDDDDQEE